MVSINLDIPKNYLEEENRNEYIISREKKEVWAVQLDLMNKLVEVCKKYGIHCFAEAGTLLGAVRHGGFIPWDDDIDMVIFRNEYEKLVQIADEEFTYPYCFQSPYTTRNYPHGHGQLRNIETTAILKSDLDNGYSHELGIFIDVFVLDAVPNDELVIEKEKRDEAKWRNLARIVAGRKKTEYSLKMKMLLFLLKLLNIKSDFFHKKADKILKAYDVSEFQMAALLSFIFETQKRIRNIKIYEDVVNVPFEFLTIPIPRDYDEYLTQRYGDYMTPIPTPTTHGDIILDASIPYTEYLKKGRLLDEFNKVY